jgi:hypothetical protein
VLIEGEAGGFFVEADELPRRRAYMKPRRRDSDPNKARAAREKIAADLAFDLGAPVPPVVLTVRNDSAEEERFVCCSLVMYPRQWSWEQVKGTMPGEPSKAPEDLLVDRLPTAAAVSLAFDTWLDQTDHGDHPHNIVFGYDPDDLEDASYVFLDYSFSMGNGGAWNDGRFEYCQPAAFPPLMMQTLDKSALSESIEKIEDYSDGQIRTIVDRIPDEHLAPHQRTVIARALCERRHLLRQALDQFLPRGTR